MKKLFAVLLICTSVVACGGGSSSTITGNPDPTSSTPVASAPEPVASPSPVAVVPPPSSLYDVNFLADAGFSVKNNAGKTETFYAYTTSFDDQKTPTATIPANGQPAITKNGDTFSGSFGAQCVQLDLSIEGPGGRPFAFAYFDINGKEISNANRDQKISECRNRCTPTWREIEEIRVITEWADYSPEVAPATVEQKCYKYQRRLVIKREQNSCNKEIRDKGQQYYETRQVEISCPCATPSAQVSGLSYPTYTPAVPAVPGVTFYYWDMNNGQGNTPKQNACEGRQGVWLGDDYNIPNDGSNNEYDDVCRTTFPGLSGQQGVDADFIKSVVQSAGTPAVPASGGNPISGSATVSGAGVWKLVLKATDPGNYEKDTDTVTLTCNDAPKTLSVSYNWIGHSSDDWQLLLYKDNVLFASSAVANNPSN